MLLKYQDAQISRLTRSLTAYIKADAEFVRKITGFAIGGIPPMGHKNTIDMIYIDQDLMLLDEVWVAAGTPNAVFCIKSKDLSEITKGKVIAMAM